MPELTQFDNGKSIIRYLPAKGTAGFVRFAVSTPKREPSPPARITARVFIDYLTFAKSEIICTTNQRRCFPHQLLIQFKIFPCRVRPRKILRHTRSLYDFPA